MKLPECLPTDLMATMVKCHWGEFPLCGCTPIFCACLWIVWQSCHDLPHQDHIKLVSGEFCALPSDILVMFLAKKCAARSSAGPSAPAPFFKELFQVTVTDWCGSNMFDEPLFVVTGVELPGGVVVWGESLGTGNGRVLLGAIATWRGFLCAGRWGAELAMAAATERLSL